MVSISAWLCFRACPELASGWNVHFPKMQLIPPKPFVSSGLFLKFARFLDSMN